MEQALPGRWAEVRPPSAKEIATTLVLALPLDHLSAKVRGGPPIDARPGTPIGSPSSARDRGQRVGTVHDDPDAVADMSIAGSAPTGDEVLLV